MVMICQQCGDEGFTNAFIYCVECLGFVSHRYCLDVLTFDEFVSWYCQDCKSKDYASSVNSEEIYSREKLKTNRFTASLVDGVERDGCQETTIEPSDSPVKVNLKKRKKGHTDYLIDETGEGNGKKVIRESDSERSPIKQDSKRKKTGNTASVSEQTEQECTPLAELCIKEKISKEMKERSKKTIKEKTCLVDMKEKSSSQLVINMECNTTSFGSETRDNRSQNIPIDPRHEFAKVVNNPLQNVHVDAQPVIDTIWTGSFDIAGTNYGIYAVAHVSSKVCTKVFEEASLLPSLLSLELLPKSDLWPKSFQENKPSDDNIALYFFPAPTGHEKVFDSLVKDMMDEDLAMRAVLTNSELLIFTSEELPKEFWRFRGKFYLWGVFKGKKANPSPSANNHIPISQGSEGFDSHTNSSKKMESGKRAPQESKGSDRIDQRTSSSNIEHGKRNQHDSRGSDRRTNSSKKAERGKRSPQQSKGSDNGNSRTNSSSGKWKENTHRDKKYGGRRDFPRSSKH